jgi:hypothetical protein
VKYYCCDKVRRELLRSQAVDDKLNGIDYLEVLDRADLPDEQRQRTLYVHFTNPFVEAPGPTLLTAANVKLEGGDSVRDVVAKAVEFDTDVMTVTVNKPGDFSRYTLRLVTDSSNSTPAAGIDPVLSSVEFSFKVNCPSDFDCKPVLVCPAAPAAQPQINYLAKDYASFRQLMLDRMALLMPDWRERHAADLGIALVELLAHVGDQLSYRQDAIATEAYLGTARRRVSVRRHARLVDYRMHDGCNARAWVHVEMEEGASPFTVAKGMRFVTRISGLASSISEEDLSVCGQSYESFEAMFEVSLRPENNVMQVHTWGDERCCLPKGATRATLRGKSRLGPLQLAAGTYLVFEEVKGPHTNVAEDADPSHRHVVCLTRVAQATDPLYAEPVYGTGVDLYKVPEPRQTGEPPLELVEIEWSPEDALPFPLCVSSLTDEKHNSELISDVSVAFGNIVLVDHGHTVTDEKVGIRSGADEEVSPVPDPTIYRPTPTDADPCAASASTPIPPRFRPQLKEVPLTFAAATPDPATPAALVTCFSPARALPSVTLDSTSAAGLTDHWEPTLDLLDCNPLDTCFVAETESDGAAFIRFGDDRNGLRPNSGTTFTAAYRVGNGKAGNVGAEAIAHIVSSESAITLVRNPLPASGGTEPESIERVRQDAPFAFRTQERAVTPEDYAEKAQQYPGVQRAVATFRWTGSWHTVFLTVDRLDGEPVDAEFEQKMVDHLEKYRMAGYDIEIDEPRYVSLEIGLDVCVKPDHFRSDVEQALLLRFSNQVLPCGRPGFFHPDNFTFDQDVYLSQIRAEAQGVDGVSWVRVTRFRQQDRPETCAIDAGVLRIGRLEVARMDNDANYPDHGKLVLNMMGGK